MRACARACVCIGVGFCRGGYIVMACIVMAYIVMAYVVMAYIVMARVVGGRGRLRWRAAALSGTRLDRCPGTADIEPI